MATGLTQERLKEVLDYNQNTGIFTWVKPNIKSPYKKGCQAGSNATGYTIICIDRKSYAAHRLAWFYVNGYWPKIIDHINNNPLDNAFHNLRESTNSENSFNMKLTKRNTTGIKGVTWDKVRQKWFAEIKAFGKKIFLGRFQDKELAELVVSEARSKYHKEFAREL